ncbi:DUF805 domain-containing protein [Rhizobiales bacterium RZME27]|uniref:DUF805 domain-containing protein n=1 Tax=Endobacterium cereale TaxID=2663029 RepID=A0A6A8ADP8_9HYPH|nr:DUF805 domain-containing protein [Endobacterium cereale]MEB2843823.1 DUF805 domain-containing protein [Endobacterium cereale]MQY49433.1 DUF805 domain-containing protein [Endobacterium cereale]
MGSFSIWHWLIILILLFVPLIFVLQSPPPGANRFGSPPKAMSFGEAIASFFRNYVNFSDRASRSEFWYATLFNVIVHFVLGFVDPSEVVSSIWGLATFFPSIAIAARRLHDINRSGWYQLLSCLFPIGTIAWIVWACQKPSDADTSIRHSDPTPPAPPTRNGASGSRTFGQLR